MSSHARMDDDKRRDREYSPSPPYHGLWDDQEKLREVFALVCRERLEIQMPKYPCPSVRADSKMQAFVFYNECTVCVSSPRIAIEDVPLRYSSLGLEGLLDALGARSWASLSKGQGGR